MIGLDTATIIGQSPLFMQIADWFAACGNIDRQNVLARLEGSFFHIFSRSQYYHLHSLSKEQTQRRSVHVSFLSAIFEHQSITHHRLLSREEQPTDPLEFICKYLVPLPCFGAGTWWSNHPKMCQLRQHVRFASYFYEEDTLTYDLNEIIIGNSHHMSSS